MKILINFLLAIALVFMPSATSAQVASAFAIKISVTKDTLKTGSELRVKVNLTNTSSQKLMIAKENESKAELDYTLQVFDQKGDPAPLTKYGRTALNGEDVLVGGFGYVPVLPGESLKDEIVVTDLYILTSPQKYSIQVHRFDEVSKIDVRSNAITVTLIP